jgi:starch phosphorylase
VALGRQNPDNQQEAFCMTVLAIRLSNYRNGVSKLHREVSRGMWKGIWPAFPERDVPVVSVTNGVHIPSYISQEMADLYDRYLGPRWIEDPDNQKVWERVDLIPDTELWRTHERRRERLIAFARRRVKEQLLRRGELPSEIKRAEDVLNPEALTICFARRFATYKRGDILFRDPKRFAKILNDPERPVQIIFAGKAHPQDMAGKAIIKNIVQHIHEEDYRYKIVFLENYDINVARYMVQGADVWLNTPRRPMEACGTSGMKAVANGALHMSVLDGWWAEGYQPGCGWAIGAGEEYEDPDYQDEIESRAIYELLEREVVPAFYARTRDGTAREWIRMMKASMRTLCPIFNTHRMLEDYVDGFYVPAAMLHQKMWHEPKQTAESFAAWKQKIQRHWREIRIQDVKLDDGAAEIPVGKAMSIRASISLGQLKPEDVWVDLYYGPMGPDGDLIRSLTEPMTSDGSVGENGYAYRATVDFRESGKFGYMLRVMPKHALLVHAADMGLVVWG